MSTRTKVVSPRSKHGVDRVAGRTRDVRHDHALLPRIAFSRLDLPTFGRPRIATRIASSPSRRPGAGQARDDRVEQVAGVVAVDRGDRDRIAQPEPVELGARTSRRGSSILFARRNTGLRAAAGSRRPPRRRA